MIPFDMEPPLYSARTSILLSTTFLMLGCVAVSHRGLFCQLQAYVVIVTLIVSYIMYDSRVEDMKGRRSSIHGGLHCVDCGGPSRAVVKVGWNHKAGTLYDAVFYDPINVWAMLAVWGGWVAYGALFHEGAHIADENALLEESSGVLRTVRVFLLVTFSFSSLLGPSEHTYQTAFVCAILTLFPDVRSTPHSLDAVELAVRTGVFITLFITSEILHRFEDLSDYVTHFDTPHRLALRVFTDVLGTAQTRRLSRKDCITVTCPPEPARYDHHIRTIISSFWVLVCPPHHYVPALVQVLICLFMVRKRGISIYDTTDGGHFYLKHDIENQLQECLVARAPPRQSSSKPSSPVTGLNRQRRSRKKMRISPDVSEEDTTLPPQNPPPQQAPRSGFLAEQYLRMTKKSQD